MIDCNHPNQEIAIPNSKGLVDIINREDCHKDTIISFSSTVLLSSWFSDTKYFVLGHFMPCIDHVILVNRVSFLREWTGFLLHFNWSSLAGLARWSLRPRLMVYDYRYMTIILLINQKKEKHHVDYLWPWILSWEWCVVTLFLSLDTFKK